MDGTSVPDTGAAAPRVVRDVQRFGTIVIVGGGCYGGYYVRQLLRAERAGAIQWHRLLVVDRNPDCPVASLAGEDRPRGLEVVTSAWEPFFARWLADAAADQAAATRDAIVPSPLMPHLMAGWLLERVRERWPSRSVAIAPLARPPATPWQRAGDDGTHYVSFADWMCPINCIEPERCPHTRGPRSWTMPAAVREYMRAETDAGRPMDGPYVFQCLHRAYGVGMLDVADIVAADRAIAQRGELGAADFLIGTVSHCHGALRRIVLGN